MTWLCVCQSVSMCASVCVRRQYRPHVVKLWQAAALCAAFQLPQGACGRTALMWWPVCNFYAFQPHLFCYFYSFTGNQWNIFHGIKQLLPSFAPPFATYNPLKWVKWSHCDCIGLSGGTIGFFRACPGFPDFRSLLLLLLLLLLTP